MNKQGFAFEENYEQDLMDSGAFNVLSINGRNLFEFVSLNPGQFTEGKKHPDFHIGISESGLRKISRTFQYKIKVQSFT